MIGYDGTLVLGLLCPMTARAQFACADNPMDPQTPSTLGIDPWADTGGAVYYVMPDNGGTQPSCAAATNRATPLRSLSYAVATCLRPGTTLKIISNPAPYPPPGVIDFTAAQGNSGSWVRIVSEDPAHPAIFDGGWSSDTCNTQLNPALGRVPWNGAILGISRARYLKVAGISVRNTGFDCPCAPRSGADLCPTADMQGYLRHAVPGNAGSPVVGSFGGCLNMSYSDHVVAWNMRAEGCNRYGFAVQSCTNVEVSRSEVLDAVKMNTDEQYANSSSPAGGWDGAFGTGLYSSPFTDADLNANLIATDNVIHDSWGEGLNVLATRGAFVARNRVFNNYSVNVYVDGSQFVQIDRNYIYNPAPGGSDPKTKARVRDSRYCNSEHMPATAIGVAISKEAYAGRTYPSMGTRLTNNIIDGGLHGFQFDVFDPNVTEGCFVRLAIAYNTVARAACSALHFAQAQPVTSDATVMNNILVGSGRYTEINNMCSSVTIDTNLATVQDAYPPRDPHFQCTSIDSLYSDPHLAGIVLGQPESYRLTSESWDVTRGNANGNVYSSQDYWGSNRSPTSPRRGAHESCAPTAMRCNGQCIDVSSDATNCGACGVVCPVPIGGSATCSGGYCGQTCSPTFTWPAVCANTCVDLFTSRNNCGWCGNRCAGHNYCNEGTCDYIEYAPDNMCSPEQPEYPACQADAQAEVTR